MPKLLKAMMCQFGTFLCLLGYAGLMCESAAQSIPRDSPSEASVITPSNRLGKLIPYAGYEERLRRSPDWQAMTPDEQAEAIAQIVLARKQFLER